jgi:hypothetical protein
MEGSGGSQRRTGSGAPRGSSAAGLRRAAPLSATAQQTPEVSEQTIKASQSSTISNRSAAGAAKKLLVAQPLEDTSGADFLDSLQQMSPTDSRPGTTQELAAVRRRRKNEIPLWLWGAIFGGAILALVLLLLLVKAM